MVHIKIGLRNLLRNSRRTFVTLFIISSGLAALLIYSGYIDYTNFIIKEITIHGGLGHVQVYKKGFNKKLEMGENRLENLVDNYVEKADILKRLPYVVEVAPLLELKGLLSDGERTETCFVYGVDPEKQKKLQGSATLIQGDLLNGEDKQKIVIGKILAKRLNVKVGGSLTLMTTTKYGAMSALDFEVKGIIETGHQGWDSVRVDMPLKHALHLLDVEGVERLIVLLQDTTKTKKIQALINKISGKKHLGFETKNWSDLAENYHKIKRSLERFFSITEIILVIMAIFAVMNTMGMVIMERMREIGTIKAVGLTKKGIVTMIFSESLWIGIFGVILGISIALIGAFIINSLGGISVPAAAGYSKGYVTLISPNVSRFFEAALLGMTAVLLGTILPSIKAARIKVVDALKHL